MGQVRPDFLLGYNIGGCFDYKKISDGSSQTRFSVRLEYRSVFRLIKNIQWVKLEQIFIRLEIQEGGPINKKSDGSSQNRFSIRLEYKRMFQLIQISDESRQNTVTIRLDYRKLWKLI